MLWRMFKPVLQPVKHMFFFFNFIYLQMYKPNRTECMMFCGERTAFCKMTEGGITEFRDLELGLTLCME